MAKEILSHLASLFQDFDRQIKDFETLLANAHLSSRQCPDLEALLAEAHQSSRQLRVSLSAIMLEVVKACKSLMQR